MEISEIRVLRKYEFHRGATTRQAVVDINSVFSIQVATNATVALWFKKFRSRDFDLSNEPRGRPKTQVDNDVLKATVEANSGQSARELSIMYNVSKQIILTHLAQIGKVKKLDKWIPYELTDAQKERRLDACLSLSTKPNHFSIKSLCAMKNGSCTIIAKTLSEMRHSSEEDDGHCLVVWLRCHPR
ncbi:histone-lysine N-methyltransferase SETMAR [Nephila pilipes]|uniref:Histone-lysine N-methyltransferase SETMAR n=1 Tax=Nephila pilipes TaxID=299642 RepID=A0A8X6PVK6_NEPPI|nr:histone-lysine N-methyltransferase SETMAR [Nephila pilipes]